VSFLQIKFFACGLVQNTIEQQIRETWFPRTFKLANLAQIILDKMYDNTDVSFLFIYSSCCSAYALQKINNTFTFEYHNLRVLV
jgi:hypothetical protein